MTFFERLEVCRLALGLSYKAFCKKIGISYRQLLDYKNGFQPRAATLTKIAQALGKTEEWVRTGEGPETAEEYRAFLAAWRKGQCAKGGCNESMLNRG